MKRIIRSLCYAFEYIPSEPDEEEGTEEDEPVVCYVEEQETPDDYTKGGYL